MLAQLAHALGDKRRRLLRRELAQGVAVDALGEDLGSPVAETFVTHRREESVAEAFEFVPVEFAYFAALQDAPRRDPEPPDVADFVNWMHDSNTSFRTRRILTQFDADSNTPDDLTFIDDVAAACGLSRSTLYRLMEREGIRRFRRAGDRKTYVSLSAVQKVSGFRPVE